MENTVDAFDFNALKESVGIDPFAKQTNRFPRDERFYKLSKDKDGNGAALIRFLPDSEKRMIVQMNKINTTVVKNGKKRFVDKFSPATIGLPCPFQEEWQRLWNVGDKEGAKLFSRSLRYITNIKILKDPANPENEGKIFLYDMSGKMNSKLEKALSPSQSDLDLGKTRKELFNPIKGNSFRLVCQMGSNNQINYDPSEVVADVTSIYNSVEEALKDINENTYKLSDLLKPESFDSYEELKKEFDRVTFKDQQNVQAVTSEQDVQPVQPVTPEQDVQSVTPEQDVQPVTPEQPKTNANDDLDAILQGLV